MPNYYVLLGEEQEDYQVVTLDDGRYRVVKPNGDEVIIDAFEPERGILHLLTEGGESHNIAVREDGGDFVVQIRGTDTRVEVLNERQLRMRAANVGGRGASGPELKSPMAGKIVAVAAAEGATVTEGEVVIVIEAMKMENDLKAHQSGTITKVAVEAGQAVEIGDVLVTIEP